MSYVAKTVFTASFLAAISNAGAQFVKEIALQADA